jgi:hypothetical protein
MSPTSATRSPAIRPNSLSSVSKSKSACVGWAWRPSPALITWPANDSANLAGKPDSGWRVTIARTPIAAKVNAVSAIVSPLPRLEAPGGKATTSAPTRCSASTNEVNVRVLASKKRLTTATSRNRSRGGGSAWKALARCSTSVSSAGLKSSRSSRLA